MELESRDRLGEAPSELLEGMATAINKSVSAVRRRQKAWTKTTAQATSIVGLFGRGSHSLAILRDMIGEHREARDTADRWLQADSPYFLLWRARDGRAAAFIPTDARLLPESLDSALSLGDSPPKTLLLAVTETPADFEALTWWKKHGGLVPTGQPARH